MSGRRIALRVALGLLWGLVMAVVFAGIGFGALVAGGYLGYVLLPRLDGGHDIGAVLAVLAVAGVALAIVVCHRARRWVQRLRLWRGCDTSAMATVVWRDRRYTAGSRGGSSTLYTVYLSWYDGGERTGEQTGERQYRFFGDGPDDFATRTRLGATLPIRYPAGRPHRFIVDIPYAPTMADLFI